MGWLHEFRLRLEVLLDRRQLDRDLQDELQFHLAMREQSSSETNARRHFGNVALFKESCRDLWTFAWLETIVQDLRYGTRTLRRSPVFTAVGVLSLALGIGANTAIFSLMDAIFWKMLPVRDPQQLVRIVAGNRGDREHAAPYELFLQGRDGDAVFSGMQTADDDGLSFTAEGRAERVMGEVVSGNFFYLLGVNAVVGRVFSAEVASGSWEPEAVLSFDFWQRRFGGDAAIVGKTIQLNGYPFTVVGVSARGFFGTEVGTSPEIRVPKLPPSLARTMPAMDLLDPSGFAFITARLKAGVGIQQAQAATEVAYQQFLRDHPEVSASPRYQGSHIHLLANARGTSSLRREFEQPLFLLMAVVGVVLLIACANLASLLLARSMVRRAEIGVRLAIGAGRARLIRQLLTESLLLSVIGGGIGIAFAFMLGKFLFTFLPQTHIEIVLDVQPDLRALCFTVVISLLTGIWFGLVPAVQATKADLVSAIKSGQESARSGLHLGKALITAEVALSLVLLITAGLIVRSFQNLKAIQGGFNVESITLFTMKHVHERYSADQLDQFCRELIQRVEALPGVWVAALSETGPFSQREGSASFTVPRAGQEPRESLRAIVDRVSPRFFESLGIQILAGRDLRYADRPGAPRVAVIDENAARDFFGGANPIGRHLSIEERSAYQGEYEIVGVVKASKHVSLKEQPQRAVYLSILQGDKPWMPTLFVRAAGNTVPLIAAVQQQFQVLDKDLPVFNIKTFRQQVDESIAGERLTATLSGFFGLLAGLLVAIGLYGIIAYSVTRRTREIGIRMAVGADRSDVRWLVMKETLSLVATGLVPGLVGSVIVSRLIATQLYGLDSTDWVTLGEATLFLLAVALIAGYLPARRAARIDPMHALRSE